MPSIIGSIPDADVEPIVAYLSAARQMFPNTNLSYNELLVCLLYAALAQRMAGE